MIAILPTLGLLLVPAQTPGNTQPGKHDHRAPELGSLRVDQHGGAATLSFRTDERSRAQLVYRQGRGPVQVLESRPYAREHRLSLAPLRPGETVTYDLEVSDPEGNVTTVPRSTFPVAGRTTGSGFEISGRLEAGHPVTLTFHGPSTNERADSPNPFLDYRLDVEVTSPKGTSVVVPGFYDGDGEGGDTGDVWRVRLATPVQGTWSFEASFRTGTEIAIASDRMAGAAGVIDGIHGTFEILPRDRRAPGFYKWGKLLYVEDHYLKFFEGPHFIKGGTNSPENLLAYAGFDNTHDEGGASSFGLLDGLHRFGPHRGDFGVRGLGDHSDPLFVSEESGYDSRGIIGALNYLSAVHVNSLFLLVMNLGGDGWEVTPFVGYDLTRFDKTHYDISKLTQWNEVFEHAARRGITLQLVLGETEVANETWLDGGRLEVERKLYYREMVARFGHLPAIKWNLGEELEFTTDQVREFAEWIGSLDPYGHPVGFHVNLLPLSGDSMQLTDVLGDDRISTNSLQAIPFTASDLVEKWRAASAASGRPWIVEFDEQLQPLTNTNATELRKLQLYDTLFSGGQVEWYAGYFDLPLGGDLRIENFRTREEMWNYTWYARKLLQNHVPFWLMQPMDELVEGEQDSYGGAEVLAAPGYYYAIYLPSMIAGARLDLRGNSKAFRARFYNPRTGSFEGVQAQLMGGAFRDLPSPPHTPSEDWVVLVTRQ